MITIPEQKNRRRLIAKLLRYVLLFTGFAVGVNHLGIGLEGVFVAKAHEPLSAWIFLFTGPFLTLPATILAFFLPRAGAILLICGAFISHASFMDALGQKGGLEKSMWYLTRISAPMLALGFGALVVLMLDRQSLTVGNKRE